MALQAYRHLLRAARIAFQGDERVLTAARQEIRSGFRAKAGLSPSDPAVMPALEHAQDVARFLKANVVQGRREDGGERYKLRIHEYTERGDNDTVKTTGGKNAKFEGGCCSG